MLLVSTSRNPELWIIPGGGIEPTEEVQMAALREVLEEAGVKGQLDRCLGVFEVCFTGWGCNLATEVNILAFFLVGIT